MHLIADIGATTGRWMLIDKGAIVHEEETAGFHPLQQSTVSLRESIRASGFWPMAKEIDVVNYYGTAITAVTSIDIAEVLGACFPFSAVHVFNDIAALAHCMETPVCIVGILGTGASSAYYNQDERVDNIPSLGWAVNDAGSGAYLGKCLITYYFTRQLSESVSNAFVKTFSADRDYYLDKIYNGDRPAAFLGSFVPFIKEHENDPIIQNILKTSFLRFINEQILPYDVEADTPILLSGGVASLWGEQLKALLAEKDRLQVHIITNPMARLVANYTTKKHT